MATVSITATARTKFGKSATRKIRFAGQMPGIVYRAGQPVTHISLNPHDLENAFRKTMDRNTLVELTLDGDTKTCLVRDAQRDPVNQALRHVDFYELDMSKPIVVEVPVKTKGIAPGMELGGVLRLIKRSLSVRCSPEAIPSGIMVDITGLEIDDYVRVSAVTAPNGAEILAETDFNVLAVVGRRIELEVEPEVEDVEGEEGVEGAEGAEGAEEGSEESGD
jgi:large subunit ribosomal protein L25